MVHSLVYRHSVWPQCEAPVRHVDEMLNTGRLARALIPPPPSCPRGIPTDFCIIRSLIDCHSPRGASLPRSPRSLHTKSATPCMRTSSPKSTTPSPNQWILPMGGGPKQVPRARKPQRWAQRSSRVRIIPNGRHGRSPTDSRMRMRTNMWVQWIMRRTNPTRVPILCSMQLGMHRVKCVVRTPVQIDMPPSPSKVQNKSVS